MDNRKSSEGYDDAPMKGFSRGSWIVVLGAVIGLASFLVYQQERRREYGATAVLYESFEPGRVGEVIHGLSGVNVETLLEQRIQASITEIELQFLEEVKRRSEIVYEGGGIVGRDNWYMTKKGSDALFSGTEWASEEEEWFSRLIEPNAINAIVQYNEALKERGIRLVLLPASNKLFFYPGKLLDSDEYDDLDESVRLDRKYFEIYELLRGYGVEIVDSYVGLRQRIREKKALLYRPDDHHLSSYGYREVAKLVYERIKDVDGLSGIRKRNYVVREETVGIKGVRQSPILGSELETVSLDILTVREVKPGISSNKYKPWRGSPVLLIGDSFVRNLSTDEEQFGAGLADHLSEQLGFPIDTLGVFGGGANEVRVELALDSGRLDGKKVVVWCFAITNFPYVSSGDGWKNIRLPRSLE